MTKLPNQYTGGREFFRLADSRSLDIAGYFLCLTFLRPLLKNPEFIESTPGYYINIITVADDGSNSIRLQYYTVNPAETLELINKFVADNQDTISLFESKETARPNTNEPLETPSDEGYKFQNFLSTNTQIVLDVLESYGVEPLRKLIYEYRNIQLPQRVPPEAIFEPIFTEHSDFFRKLKQQSLDKQYWEDLCSCFKPAPIYDFGLHFLVNIVILPDPAYNPIFFDKGWISR